MKRTLAAAVVATALAAASLAAGRFLDPARTAQLFASEAVSSATAKDVALHYLVVHASSRAVVTLVSGGVLRPDVRTTVCPSDLRGLPGRAVDAGYWRVDVSRPSLGATMTVVVDRRDAHVAAFGTQSEPASPQGH